ncbi:hypothetical protein ACFFKC_16350 [Pseudoduganella danionis]|uniref:Uncharacterized protein n=1 Tax=Pseudoduganella danionis TaxID=1890295 RepID=A0ABW9SRW4_9BURK|nr:hypothetical protein [Pseudoduganella danionis]MTW33462.1 hypothetical protein [Pseudoduganella danionis]
MGCYLVGLAVAIVPLLGALAPAQLAAVVPLLGVLSPAGGLGRDAAARCAAAWWSWPWPLCRCSARCSPAELARAVMPLRCSAARYAVAWW